jgi:hypothetical protein
LPTVKVFAGAKSAASELTAKSSVTVAEPRANFRKEDRQSQSKNCPS